MLPSAESDALLGLLWRTTWQASALAVVVLAVTSVMRRWIAPKWRSVLWTVPMCRLLMLLVPTSALSLFNLFGAVDSEAPPIVAVNATARTDALPVVQAASRSSLESIDAQLPAPTASNKGELLIQLARRPSQVSGIAHMAARRSNVCARINELASPTRSTPLRSTFAFIATVAFVISGLTDAALTQDSQPGNREQAAASQGQRLAQHQPTDATAESATSQPTAPATAFTNAEEKIARIRETANWRFVDKGFIETIEKRQSELQGTAVTVLGIVRDEQNQPVEGAFVLLCLHPSAFSRTSSKATENVFAVTWTDDKGVFEFRHQPTPWLEPTAPVFWELNVFAPGHAIETRKYRYMDDQIRNEKLHLQRERVIEGTIKDPDGRPISHVEVAHVEIVNPYDNANLDYTVFRTEMTCYVESDEQGEFQIGGLPPQRIATIIPRRGTKLGGMRAIHIATSANLEPEKMIAKDRPRSGLVYPYLEPVFEIVTDRVVDQPAKINARSNERTVKPLPTRTVTVRVVNAEDGGGVSGVAVDWEDNVDELWINPGMHVTDKDGTTKLEIPHNSVEVFVGGRRFGFVTHYDRFTTGPEEYTPPVERADWVRRINPGEQDLDVTFKLQSVAPLQITVQKEDGMPAKAELRVSRHGWLGCQMPAFYSDERGQASIAIRPVFFDADITATTEDGLKGSLHVQLSKNLTEPEIATVVVK